MGQGSFIAMSCGVGHRRGSDSCSSNLTPSLGTSICHSLAIKSNDNNNNNNNKTVVLFRRPAAWGEGGLVSKSQLPTVNHWAGGFKGEFWGCIEGGSFMQPNIVMSDNHLEISHVVVGSVSS